MDNPPSEAENDRKTEFSFRPWPGVLIAITLFGAIIGWIHAGEISDGPTQSLWISESVFWTSLLFASSTTMVLFLMSGYRMRLAFLIEIVTVAAILSMFFANLQYYQNSSRNFRIRREAVLRDTKAQMDGQHAIPTQAEPTQVND